jgi:hypothetical protein
MVVAKHILDLQPSGLLNEELSCLLAKRSAERHLNNTFRQQAKSLDRLGERADPVGR